MSVTNVVVQLPSFSYSFSVSIPSTSTILDFKNEIARICSGGPSAGGQRVIYKGRVLSDTEIVGEVWRAMDMPHTCHLAVHPSAWTTTPPNGTSYSVPAFSQPMPPRAGASSPRVVTTPLPTPHATYAYIQYMHTNALRILARQPRLPWPEQMGNMDGARGYAKRGVEASGRGWPAYLNQDFPAFAADASPEEGIKYASVHIENLPYLSLLTPDATPTPLQSQAIRVLRYTFPLLCVYSPPQPPHNVPVQVHPLPPRALLPVPAAIPRIPIRPLIIPLLLLTFRTALLLYFFRPARKPLFGLMVIVWVIWEIAGAVRGAGGENRQHNRAQAPDNPNAAVAGVRAGAPAGARAVPGNRPANDNIAPRPAMNSHDDALNRLARINLATEAPLLESDSRPDPNTPPPSLSHKLKMFFGLLALTLHPAIWDRRRTALRAREGRVREDARTREARALQQERERVEREDSLRRRRVDGVIPVTPDTPEPPPLVPRPAWVAEYIQRVRSGDWVDD